MGDILKEAIADAKAVRETALENAKMALEEAFTPQLKSMLSAKLKEDELEEGDPVFEDEGEGEEEVSDEEVPAEEMYGEEEGEEEPEEAYHEEEGEEEAEEAYHEEEGEEDLDELDLEAVIKELESELTEEDDAYDENAEATGKEVEPMGEGEESDDEKEDVKEEEGEDDEETVDEQDDAYDENVEGKKDPEHVGDEETGVAGTPPLKSEALEAELKEYKEAVVFLKDKLHEVNILNAKLLFTNKLFKEYALDNGQKLKVVETFDRAQTTREIKLVYSTLAEQFSDNGSISKRNSISESASAPVASTKPSKESKKVISEENQVANRFKKLAGLIK